MNRAIIVSQPSDTASLIEQTVRSEGFGRTSSVSSGGEARRMIKSESESDLIIINAPLTDEFGQELAETAAEETSAGIILVCPGDVAEDVADRLSSAGISVIPRPVSRQLLARTIRLVSANRTRMLGLTKENPELMTRIDEMRLINRAKSTLMKYLKFTEPQAHRYIEKQAMNTRQTRREVAMRILATYER